MVISGSISKPNNKFAKKFKRKQKVRSPGSKDNSLYAFNKNTA